MPGSTPKYAVPYSIGSDDVKTVDDTMKAQAERVDLLLGESGIDNIQPSAADTITSKRINYARSYAALAPLVPMPFVAIRESVTTAQQVVLWTSSEDATGFTVNIRANTTAARNIRWRTGV